MPGVARGTQGRGVRPVKKATSGTPKGPTLVRPLSLNLNSRSAIHFLGGEICNVKSRK